MERILQMRSFVQKNAARILIAVYAAILFYLNFIRIFDNNFWGDETYTIRLAQMQFSEMIAETAGDVHPPLYYLLVRLFRGILGSHGYVFHLASLAPYGIAMILALTVLWKRCGWMVSLSFITLSSLLPMAVEYNVEVRMYSWGALFVLLSYLFLWQIYSFHRTRDYAGFVIFSLAAAYTHYYCLISVAFFYITLLLTAFIWRTVFLKKTLISCIFTIVGYLPWFFILLHTLARTSGDFWMMWIPTLEECLGFLFEGRFQYLLFASFLLAAVFFFIRQLGGSNGSSEGTASEASSLRLWRIVFSPDVLWVCAGLLSIFGTIFTGIMVSRIIRPLFITRYLYPVASIAWLLLSFCPSKLKGRLIYMIALNLLLLISCVPAYQDTFLRERAENERLQTTLAETAGIGTGDIILTDLAQIDWTIADYYYPEASHQLVTLDEIPEIQPNMEYWLILDPAQSEKLAGRLSTDGYPAERIMENGILGTTPVTVYRLSSEVSE